MACPQRTCSVLFRGGGDNPTEMRSEGSIYFQAAPQREMATFMGGDAERSFHVSYDESWHTKTTLNVLFSGFFSETRLGGKKKKKAKKPEFITHHLQRRPPSTWWNAKWREVTDACRLSSLSPCPLIPYGTWQIRQKMQDQNLAFSFYSGIYFEWAENSSDQVGGEDV